MKLLLVLLLLQDTGTYRIGNGVSAPTILSKVEPDYPEAARAAKVQGTAVLEVTISEDGVPHVLRVVKPAGYGMDENAVAALEKWRFKPAMKDGMPVKVTLNVEVNFNMQGPPGTSQATVAPPRAAVQAVAVDPASPNTIYAATRNGLFKTTDGGANWRLTGPFENVITLVVDPRNSSTVYAGSTTRGILRSSDSGGSWTPLDQLGTRVIQLDPANPSTLYAATARGIIKSVDGGNTWAELLPGNAFTKLSVNSNAPASLLAVSDSGELFASNDAGMRWQFIGTGLVDQPRATAALPRTVTFSPSDVIDHALTAPKLLSPAEGAVFDTFPRKTTVKWAPSEDAVSYLLEWDYSYNGTWHLESSKNPDFGYVVQGTEFSFDFVGAQPGRWRVFPVNAAGQRGDSSEWRTFRYTR